MAPSDRSLSLVTGPALREQPAPFSERSDDDLMLLARGGVDGSFSELVRRHQKHTLRVAFRYLGEPALAADVAQNTFVAIFHALATYKAQGHFQAYLYRVLLNQCRMAQRSARVQARALETLSLSRELDATAVLARERRRDVERALQQLSQKLRDVVLLRYGADLGYQDIAGVLEIPLGTVKRRLFVAMGKLRDTLEEP